MDITIGLLKKDFEATINCFTLAFDDIDIENSYREARVKLRLVSVASKWFLLAILVGYFILDAIDIAYALGMNPNYTFDTQVWIVYSLLIPVIICELFCYFFESLSSFRGIAITIVGCLVIFHNNFYNFESQAFYPFVGTE